MRIVAVPDVIGGLYCEGGFDVDELIRTTSAGIPLVSGVQGEAICWWWGELPGGANVS